MRRVSKYEHAFRAGRGEPVELAESEHDDADLERLTAPTATVVATPDGGAAVQTIDIKTGQPGAPVVVTPPAAVEAVVTPGPVMSVMSVTPPPAPATPAKPAGKK